MQASRLVIAAVACAAVVAVAPVSHGASYKLGVVDMQKVMEALPSFTKAIAGLKTDWEKKQSALEAKQADLKKKKEALEAKKTVSDPKTLAAEEAKLLESARAFTEEAMRAQQEIAQREAKLKEVLLARLERVVYEIAEQDDFSFVFEAGAPNAPNVLYAKQTTDLTPQVIAGYKAKFGDQAIEVPAGGAPEKKADKPATEKKK